MLSAPVGAQNTFPDDSSSAQDSMKRLLTGRRSNECQEYVYNAQHLIPKLYFASKLDSIQLVLNFLQERCELSSLQTTRILLQIERDSFESNPCDSATLDLCLVRQYYTDCFFGYYGLRIGGDGYYDLPYDSLLAKWATILLPRTDSLSIQHLVARRVAGDTEYGFSLLATHSYGESCLQRRYDTLLESALRKRNDFRWNWSITTGVWFPVNSDNPLYTAFELGGSAGIRTGRWGIDVLAVLRFADDNESILLRHNDSMVRQNRFVGTNFALGPTFRVLASKRHSFELFGAIGHDSFEAYSENKEYEYVNSFAISVGAVHRVHIGKRRDKFIGVQGRYTVVDYVTHGGTSLPGNTLAINLIVGYEGNGSANDQLESLRYFKNY